MSTPPVTPFLGEHGIYTVVPDDHVEEPQLAATVVRVNDDGSVNLHVRNSYSASSVFKQGVQVGDGPGQFKPD